MATYLVIAQTGSAKINVSLTLLRHNVYSRPCLSPQEPDI